MKIFALLSAVCVVVSPAPPTLPRHYQQRSSLQAIDPLEFLADTTEITNFYNPLSQRQGAASNQNARLETLEPDSEVELIPGAQLPQQPPQQTPVAPNLPGLAPGQRVFIVHMPVPGYRPGSIGGYQPVYIVAAAPQGNNGYAPNGYATNGYPANGYQNAVLLNPASQFVNPYFGYPGVGGIPAQGAPISQGPGPHGLQNAGPQQQGQASQDPGVQTVQSGAGQQGFAPQNIIPQGFAPQGLGAQGPIPQRFGGPSPQGPIAHNAPGFLGVPLGYSRPFNQFYQNPYGFQFAPAQSAQALRNNLQFSQLVNLQQAGHPANPARNVGQESIQDASQQKRVGISDENETKESVESQQSQRPTHEQINKA